MIARGFIVLFALAGCDKLFLGKEPPDALTAEDISSRPFDTPVPFANLNTSGDEDRATLTSDLLHLVFHRGGVLMASSRTRVDADFDPPLPITELTDTKQTVRGCISRDGKRLYFSREVDGGNRSDFDIFVTTRPAVDAAWEPPHALDELTTMFPDGDERCGWESPDATTLLISTTFYASQDIVKLGRTAPGTRFISFDPQIDFNSGDREGAPWATADASIVVFDRTDPNGNVMLWQGTLQGTRYAVRPLSELGLPGRNGSPWLSDDGRTMVFTHENDLYIATR